jgi:CRISPR-associated protein Csd2
MPRMDLETSLGLTSDVCLKHKVRNYVEMVHGGEPPNAIYVTEGSVLGDTHDDVIAALGIELKKKGKKTDKKDGDEPSGKASNDQLAVIKKAMCERHYDIRTFGAVLANKSANDAVRGPVQLSFARSIEPITPQRHAITRCAAQNEEENKENKTMGAKWTVPYGLYRAHGYILAPLAARSGFSEADLELLWQALANMLDHDRSSARGEMAARRLIVFKHGSTLGNAPAHKLFETVTVARVTDPTKPARAWSDYSVEVGAVPEGIEVIEKIPHTVAQRKAA